MHSAGGRQRKERRATRKLRRWGSLTAYAGDEYMLGRKTQALTEVSRFGSQVTPKYLLALQEFLHDTGYESQRRPPCHKA